MGVAFPGLHMGVAGLETSKSLSAFGGTVSHNRNPDDAIYFADVTLLNIKCGSRYQLGYNENNEYKKFSPTFNDIVPGVEGDATDLVIPGVPAFNATFLLEVRVRKASSGQKYQKLIANGLHNPSGGAIYCNQIPDEVAS